MALNSHKLAVFDCDCTLVNGQSMIADTTYDMLMACNAGTRVIGVTWGYHDADKLLTAGADAMVARSEDILAVLTNMVEES